MTIITAIEARWAELEAMNRSELRVSWTKAFDTAPPHFLSMLFMRKALIWIAQCREYGGMPTDLKRALKSATAGGKPVRAPAPALRTGTQLTREWNDL